MEPSEQAPSTPPSKRRRRRWLIVALVFVLSTVAWWCWPRGDARFVGKWDGQNSLLVNPLTLRSNGYGFISLPAYKSVFTWHIEGEWLVLGQAPTELLEDAAAWVSSAGKTHVGLKILTREFRYKIVEVATDKLILQLDGRGMTTEYRRVPE